MRRETDLLFGIVSCNMDGSHYFVADFDGVGEDELMERIGKILIAKRGFGHCYLVRSSYESFHVLNFTNRLAIREYVDILKEIGADANFTKWVEKVGYGVLRISRRSRHFLVPILYRVLLSPFNRREDTTKKLLYLSLLGLEGEYKTVARVRIDVPDRKQENIEKCMEKWF